MLRISHRGPDGSGTYVSPRRDCALGHRRLAIIDTTTTGRQPMVSRCGRYVISFNGEIYNFRELRADLLAQGAVFRGTSDTEVLVELFAQSGIACLSRLRGIFALAVYDERQEILYLARDSMGVKPLYFSDVGDRFAFSSELKGVVTLLDRRPTFDVAAIGRYVKYLWCPGDGTPFREIRKVRPGEVIVVSRGRIVQRYRYKVFHAGQVASGDETTAKDVRAAFDDAVERQLVSDVPIGSFLSGGVDSSAVVASAVRHRPGIQCYTLDTAGEQDSGVESDLPYAEQVAKHLHVPLEVVTLGAAAFVDALPGLVQQLDEPQADPAALAVLQISSRARANGIKVMLSGIGGDDLFAGYRRHQALYWADKFGTLPLWAIATLKWGIKNLDQRRGPVRQAARLLDSASGGSREQLIGLFGWLSDETLVNLFAPSLIESELLETIKSPLATFLNGQTVPASPVRECLMLEQEFFLPDHNLAYADKMSMAAGVEVRVPFLDEELVRLSRSLSVSKLMPGGRAKGLLKASLKDLVPPNVLARKKVGFGAPVRRWVGYEMTELIEECLSERSIRSRGVFDPQGIKSLLQQNATGAVEASYSILALVCFELWARQYVDGAMSWKDPRPKF